jgi:hypothetical protein
MRIHMDAPRKPGESGLVLRSDMSECEKRGEACAYYTYLDEKGRHVATHGLSEDVMEYVRLKEPFLLDIMSEDTILGSRLRPAH